jgi:hypothetical protein
MFRPEIPDGFYLPRVNDGNQVQILNLLSAPLKENEEDSSTLNLPIWLLDGALDTGHRFGDGRWRQGKKS